MVKLKSNGVDTDNLREPFNKFIHLLSPSTPLNVTGAYSEQVHDYALLAKNAIRQFRDDLTGDTDISPLAREAEVKAKKLLHKIEHALEHDHRLSDKTKKTLSSVKKEELEAMMGSIRNHLEKHRMEVTEQVPMQPDVLFNKKQHKVRKEIDAELQRAKQRRIELPPQEAPIRINIPKGSGRF